MASIITMNSKQFLRKFMDNYDYKNYVTLLISEDIKTKGNYKNAFSVKALIPPAHVISVFVENGYTDKYKKKYKEYLAMNKVESLLTIMCKIALYDKKDVILLCSEFESQYKYIDIISKYLKSTYGVETISFKDYAAGKKYKMCKDKKITQKIVREKLTKVNPETSKVLSNKAAIIDKLKSLSKKNLKAYCTDRDIDIKQKDEKDDIIKKIIKFLYK